MRPFTQRAVEIISQIPAGTVMTYGQIAGLAGSPRGARQVVRILHSMSKKHKLPWHRVINAKGMIALADEFSFHEQKMRLEAEGVRVSDDGAIDMNTFQYVPAEELDPFLREEERW
ncbi:MGMT family protein [Brevibacillus centrosporus]|uniref:Methylated-DNA-protein-cysteine methyltransferase related protein n=1 Tax=Brevibacillus centrosporus TaxID=54910 RepID=A0A1I3XBQ1_9BACL|nr:MGMT family protein [Brevibacillus centrosporus]MEC2133176.1 MGMT family protein [Brevibacillus centrosporus]RNB65002.1 MGMT family protein [Brevibacillus centrosporus]GED31221.1 methylated-DNA--[protein]-cysteine S-methyltransferase [Brevibacillus centrosporus]SFK16960.1 methylated-DNA-protein-cysteine methyltransferase related protein [Brevibacillus centrosporus]